MELRNYQAIDAMFLSQTASSGCFNEQRTGKTPTALAVIKLRKVKKVLILCPSSAIYVWTDAYATWLKEPCIALVGTPQKRKELLKQWTHGLVVSYDTFKKTKSNKGMIEDILKQKPEMVITDEAHRFKTPKSAVAQAVFKTINTPYRLALTGTPAPGKAHEIYSILHWLFPKHFPSFWKFIDEYFNKETKYGKGSRAYVEIQGFKKGKQTQLQNFLLHYCTQRKRIEVMPWLSPKDYVDIKLPCTPAQTKYLEHLHNFFEIEHVVTHGVLDRLIRYRQICLDPKLLDLKGSSPKTDWVLSYLTDYPEKSVIIFSKFTAYINNLEKILQEKEIPVRTIVGATPLQQRKENVALFQAGKIPVLLLNIDAGKEALTLDKADAAIFTDKYPPIGAIEQAEDRIVATTEGRSHKETTIYNLIMKDTYDENVYELLKQRKSETDLINDFKQYIHKEK